MQGHLINLSQSSISHHNSNGVREASPRCAFIRHSLPFIVHRHQAPPPSRPSSLPSIQPLSESEDPDASLPSTSARCRVDPEALAAAERSIAAQQGSGLPPPYDFAATKRIVETAMLAAVAALSYSLAVLLKLEGYLSYILPLPIVLAALRGGLGAAVKCLSVAFLLLFILMGPFRAITYLFMYGFLSLAMGATCSMRLPWSLGVPLGAVSRVAGILFYSAASSILINENILALMLHNMHALLDQFSAFTGSSGGPSVTAVAISMASMLLVNTTFYVFMMHLLYTLILKGMGYTMGPVPKFLDRIIGQT